MHHSVSFKQTNSSTCSHLYQQEKERENGFNTFKKLEEEKSRTANEESSHWEEVVLISGMSLLADGVRMNWRTVIDGREWNSYKKDGWPREKF